MINFLKIPGHYQLRRHFRAGLRSQLLELISTRDLEKEIHGILVNGIRRFPRAKPLKMVRILKNRFSSCATALEEITRYRTLLAFLGSDFVAQSEEFIVEHHEKDQDHILLCGLQEYIEGTILDPWHLSDERSLEHFYTPNPGTTTQEFTRQATSDIKRFAGAVTAMVKETGLIPDLAGDGNLMLSHGGCLKLVDINNIIKIKPGPEIQLDDKGYPCCDKSIEVLSILGHKIARTPPTTADDPFLGKFFDQDRKQRVNKLEQAFYQNL